MKKKKRVKAGSIVLYVLSVVLLCYGAYMFYSAYAQVSEYYGYQGMSIMENLGEALQYMVSQSCLYVFFSILFYVSGVLLQKLNDLLQYVSCSEQIDVQEENDEVLPVEEAVSEEETVIQEDEAEALEAQP